MKFLKVDGKEITIGKGYAGIIILNIGSYSSGAQIWGPTTPSDKSLGVTLLIIQFFIYFFTIFYYFLLFFTIFYYFFTIFYYFFTIFYYFLLFFTIYCYLLLFFIMIF